MIQFTVPIKPRPTPRPRGKQGQKAYYPTDYQAYKDKLEWAIKLNAKGKVEPPYVVHAVFDTDEIRVIVRHSDARRNGLRGDIDNFGKGLLDAMEAVGVIDSTPARQITNAGMLPDQARPRPCFPPCVPHCIRTLGFSCQSRAALNPEQDNRRSARASNWTSLQEVGRRRAAVAQLAGQDYLRLL